MEKLQQLIEFMDNKKYKIGNREIRFRAYDKTEKKFYTPIHRAYIGELFELVVCFSGDLLAHTTCGIDHESLWKDRYILMQYTGFKDKNEKEVYECDVLKCKWKDVKDREWTWVCPALSPQNFHAYSELEDIDFEVIGNIFENTELLNNNEK